VIAASSDKDLSLLLSKASEQGLVGAQLQLEVLYEKGTGVQDYVKGYAWFTIAAKQGDVRGEVKKALILKRMSPDQIDESERLSTELYNKIYNHAD